MKKAIAIAVLLMTVIGAMILTGCDMRTAPENTSVRVGMILSGDETNEYTLAHVSGVEEAIEALNIAPERVLWDYDINEQDKCRESIDHMADLGCTMIISTGYDNQIPMEEGAKKYPDITFIACQGDRANVADLPNFKNAYTEVYKARYLSGIVAGMKVRELGRLGKIPKKCYEKDGSVKLGYVAAFDDSAAVTSGYTAYLMGVKSVYENVTLEVKYIDTWFDVTKETDAAAELIDDGCLIISQHTYSAGVCDAVEVANAEGETVFSVGYNADMRAAAEASVLTSAVNNWSVFYMSAFSSVIDGSEFPTDYLGTYREGAVGITELGDACAKGTYQEIQKVEQKLASGDLKVFESKYMIVDGKKLKSFKVDIDGKKKDAIQDGEFRESYFRSCPYFNIELDEIKEIH